MLVIIKMIYCTEILPNIWWMYTNKYQKFSQEDLKYINRFNNHHKIKTFLKLDNYSKFWNKANKFIIDIKKQLEMKEINNLKVLIGKLIKLIYGNYLAHNPTLIISNEYNEIGYLLWLYYFKNKIDIPMAQICESLDMKLLIKIPLSEKERRFVSLMHEI